MVKNGWLMNRAPPNSTAETAVRTPAVIEALNAS